MFMKKILNLVLNILLFVGGLYLIFTYHKEISMQNLGLMTVGLCMLLGNLYLYNRKFK
ncbi:DUF6903 family protein [Erysipelothrix inopinata]|uniref:DUF6903 family protein n=2 Tax=Erysipelothrix inopinata TaxID=225084 RepID=UPI0039F13CCD